MSASPDDQTQTQAGGLPGVRQRAAHWRDIFSRENLWALTLAVVIILIFTCATMGVQPEFIYRGF